MCRLQCTSQSCIHLPHTIKIQTLSLPRGFASQRDMMRLTAYDNVGQPLVNTRFVLLTQKLRFGRNDGDEIVDTRVIEEVMAPFALRSQTGRGTLYARKVLDAPAQYVLTIRATSFDNDPEKEVEKYQTDFLVYVTVAQYTF
jgi:hypothetical protein